jgi:hypothetical protein
MNPYIALTAACVVCASASAANPLLIPGSLTPSDLIATGFDGPNTPNADTFYYDYYVISVDVAGDYEFTIEASSASLAPWVGIYSNNFNVNHYFDPAPIDLGANGVGGSVASVTIPLVPGTYEVLASSVDWIEEADALDEGDYLVSIVGPAGANIELVPTPGSATMIAMITPFMLRRRRN